MGIKIEDLPPLLLPTDEYKFPVMLNDQTYYMSVAQVVEMVQDLILDGAPEALDTLKEIATSLGNNANLSTTLMNAINGKQPLLGFVPASVDSLNNGLALKADATALTSGLALKQDADDLVGMIAFWPFGTPPNGWIKCNGAVISRTTYAKLFAKYGTSYGSGNGSTTFGIPDVRGYFPRFWDDGRGVDSGRGLGVIQAHQVLDHQHFITPNTAVRIDITNTIAGTGSQSYVVVGAAALAGTRTSTIDSTAGVPFGAENRPPNFSLMGIVKY